MSDDITILFAYGRWRLIMWDNLIASPNTEKEAREMAAKILENPNPLRAYIGLPPFAA